MKTLSKEVLFKLRCKEWKSGNCAQGELVFTFVSSQITVNVFKKKKKKEEGQKPKEPNEQERR